MRKMRDSGVEWIGEVPEGWEVIKNRAFLKNVSVRNHPDATVLSLYRDLGVIPKLSRDDNHNVTGEDTAQYKFVEKGDLVINKMKAWQGSVGLSEYEGIVSPAYYVCRFWAEIINKKYAHYLLRNQKLAQEFEKLSTGMRVGQWDLGIDDFLRVPIPLPPLPEQRLIADYLDEKCAAIDGAVDELKRGIEDCKAWKKAIIFEAVTGKANVLAASACAKATADKKNAKVAKRQMRDSGIPWIGEIPEGWEINKGRFLYDIATGKKDVNAESPNGQYVFFTCSKTAKRIDTYSFDCEALLVAGNGDVGFTQYYKGKFDAYQRTYVLSNFSGVAPHFLKYYMSGLLPLQAQYNSVGSVIEFIKLGDLKGLAIPLPSLPEQRAIADYLDEKCAAIDALVAEKEKLIADLETYKKSLIFELVTGKREVA